MSKHHESQKQEKKKPMHTAKEKKAAKQAKKLQRNLPAPPLLPH